MNAFHTVCAHLRAKNMLTRENLATHLAIAEENENYVKNLRRTLDKKKKENEMMSEDWIVERPVITETQAIMDEVRQELEFDMSEEMW